MEFVQKSVDIPRKVNGSVREVPMHARKESENLFQKYRSDEMETQMQQNLKKALDL